MASLLLFGNQNRVKLVDDDEENENPQRNTTRLGSLLKPNRMRLMDPNRLSSSKDDSMTSFDNDSLLSSADGSGEADSLAPQASIAPSSSRPLHLPSASSSATVDSSFDSLRPLGSIKEPPETSSHRKKGKPPLPSGGAGGHQSSTSLFATNNNGHAGAAAGATVSAHSRFQQSETSLSFFDPDASRTSFFQEEEAEELENSGRPTTKLTADGFPASRSITKDLTGFGTFEPDDDDEEAEEADEMLSPGGPASPFNKPKVGFPRNGGIQVQSLRLRTSDFGIEDFKVVPSTPSDRSRSRRSLPSSLARSHSVDESSPVSSGTRSLRTSRRTALRASVSDSAKSPSSSRLSTITAIDLSKAGEVAREAKSNSLRAHRSSIKSASIRRSANRNNSIKDRRTIDGVLNNILGDNHHGEDDDDAFLQMSPTTPDSSRRSYRSSSRRTTPTSSTSKQKVDGSFRNSESGQRLLDDVDFPEPYFSPTSAKSKKKKVRSSEDRERSTRSARTAGDNDDDKEETTRSSRRGSTRRSSRTLDKYIKEKSDDNLELAAPTTPTSPMKESVGGKSRSSRGTRRTSGGDEVDEEGRSSSRKSRTLGKCRKSTDREDVADFDILSPTKSKSYIEEAVAAEDKRSSRKSRTSNGRHHEKSPSKKSESKEVSDKFGSEFVDFTSPSSTTKSPKVAEKINSGFSEFITKKSHELLGFEDSFGSFKSEDPSITSPTLGATRPSVRERAMVEPKISRARISAAPIIPKHLKEASRNKDEELDNSGHTNYTKATNWNWEEDNWEAQEAAKQPATIQEEDEEEANPFGSPTIHSRKGLDSSLQMSSPFLSPVVQTKESAFNTSSTKAAELGNFFETSSGTSAAEWNAPSHMDRSVASAPVDDPFSPEFSSRRELQRANSCGKPPRHDEQQPHRRSDPVNHHPLSTTKGNHSSRRQRVSASELPSPRAVEAVFGANDTGLGRSRPSTSPRRGSHNQRKGAVRDSMFNFLESDADKANPEDLFFS